MKKSDLKASLDMVSPTEFQKERMFQSAIHGRLKRVAYWKVGFVFVPLLVIGFFLSQRPPQNEEISNSMADEFVEVIVIDRYSHQEMLFNDLIDAKERFEVEGKYYVETDLVVDNEKIGGYLFTLESSNEMVNGAIVYEYEENYVVVQMGDEYALFIVY